MNKEKSLPASKKGKMLLRMKGLLSSRKRVAGLIVIIVLLSLLGWRVFHGSEQVPQLQTAQVERGTIVSSIAATGQILVSNINTITSQASGTVKEVYVTDGETVQEGQKIAEITLDLEGAQSQSQAYASYLSAKNSLESAKVSQFTLQADMFSAWDDFKELAESDSYDTQEERALPQFHISETQWLASEAKYKNQQSVIAQTQASLGSAWLSYQRSSANITAPSTGTLTGLTIAPGMQVGSSDASSGNRLSQRVAAIVTEGKPLATFQVSEIDVSSVKPGQQATITLDSIPDKTFTGEVVSVDKIGSVSSGVTNYPVIIRFDTSAEQLLPNMTASANIIIERKTDVLIVPSSAVQSQAGQSAVRVLRNAQGQSVSVETGISSDTQTEILSGVFEGETVITGTESVSDQSSQGSSPFGGFGAGSFGGGARFVR